MNENLKAILEEEISVYLSFKDVLDYFDYIDTYPDEIESELLTLATLATTVTWSEYEELLVDPKIDYIEIYNKDEVHELEYETGVRINGQSYSDLQAGPLTNPHVINRWNAGYTGRGVNLLIIDNFFENAYSQSGVLDISFKQIIDYTSSTTEWNNNHGMAMSSFAAAKLNNSGLVGAAYNCNLYGAACGTSGGIGVAIANEALNWAVQNKMDIVSMSFGSFNSYSTTRHNLIKNCYNNNILLFAAAGNEYGDINPNTTKYAGLLHYPSDYTEVICVSSVLYNETTKTYTNQYIYSDNTDISIHSPRRSYNLKGTNSYNTIRDRGSTGASATSGATAYAAGIAATIKEQYPNITREQFLYLMNKNKTSVAYGLGYVPNLSSYGEKVYSIKDSSAELGWRGCEMNIISGGGGSTPIYHTVVSGDSWWGIANYYGYAATLEQIYAWNNSNANTVIHPGDKVIVGYK